MNSIQPKGIFRKLSGKSTKIGCIVLFSILVICFGIQNTKTEPTTTVITPIPLITISPIATLDEKVVLHQSINQVLGTDNKNLPRLIKISYNDPERGDITITWAINDNVSQNSRKINAQIDATNILKVLENNKARFIYVILIGIFSTQVQYDNPTEIQVMNLGFNKSKLDKINWEKFRSSDIYNLADIAVVADEWE